MRGALLLHLEHRLALRVGIRHLGGVVGAEHSLSDQLDVANRNCGVHPGVGRASHHPGVLVGGRSLDRACCEAGARRVLRNCDSEFGHAVGHGDAQLAHLAVLVGVDGRPTDVVNRVGDGGGPDDRGVLVDLLLVLLPGPARATHVVGQLRNRGKPPLVRRAFLRGDEVLGTGVLPPSRLRRVQLLVEVEPRPVLVLDRHGALAHDDVGDVLPTAVRELVPRLDAVVELVRRVTGTGLHDGREPVVARGVCWHRERCRHRLVLDADGAVAEAGLPGVRVVVLRIVREGVVRLGAELFSRASVRVHVGVSLGVRALVGIIPYAVVVSIGRLVRIVREGVVLVGDAVAIGVRVFRRTEGVGNIPAVADGFSRAGFGELVPCLRCHADGHNALLRREVDVRLISGVKAEASIRINGAVNRDDDVAVGHVAADVLHAELASDGNGHSKVTLRRVDCHDRGLDDLGRRFSFRLLCHWGSGLFNFGLCLGLLGLGGLRFGSLLLVGFRLGFGFLGLGEFCGLLVGFGLRQPVCFGLGEFCGLLVGFGLRLDLLGFRLGFGFLGFRRRFGLRRARRRVVGIRNPHPHRG